MTKRAGALFLAGTITACNAVAGISDFYEVASFGDADGAVDASSANDGGRNDAPIMDDGSADDSAATIDAEAEAAAPSCTTGVPVQITVITSPTLAYSGVDVHAPLNLAQAIPGGESRTICPMNGDILDLRGIPDKSGALHRWDGAACGTAGRCKITVAGPQSVTVHLE